MSFLRAFSSSKSNPKRHGAWLIFHSRYSQLRVCAVLAKPGPLTPSRPMPANLGSWPGPAGAAHARAPGSTGTLPQAAAAFKLPVACKRARAAALPPVPPAAGVGGWRGGAALRGNRGAPRAGPPGHSRQACRRRSETVPNLKREPGRHLDTLSGVRIRKSVSHRFRMGRIKRPDADSTTLQCTLTGPYTTLARVSFSNDLCDAALRGAGLFTRCR